MPHSAFLLRPARLVDVPAIAGLVHELAAFEQLSHLVQLNPDDLGGHLFGRAPQNATPTWPR